MKVLVLGESSTSGARTGGVSWTTVMRDRLAAESGELVELEDTTFIATGERAPGVASRRVADGKPDLVLIPVGPWVFTSKFVWLRVQRLFGRRAGRWFRDFEQVVDGATYERGRTRGWVNATLRKTAHVVLGAEAITTREESAAVFDETFTQLAREEDVDVVVVPYAQHRRIYRDPRVVAERQLYMDAVRASAEARHFLWVEPAAAYAGGAGMGEMTQSDDLHISREGQEIQGEHVAAAYLAEKARGRG